MISAVRAIVVLAALLAVAHARPGIWVAEDGSQLIGSARLQCYRFSLATYSSQRLTCGSCVCTDMVFVSASHAMVQFDHTLGSVTVNGVRHNIPRTQNTYGCDSDQVKAYALVCDSPMKIYRVSGSEDYECRNRNSKRPCKLTLPHSLSKK